MLLSTVLHFINVFLNDFFEKSMKCIVSKMCSSILLRTSETFSARAAWYEVRVYSQKPSASMPTTVLNAETIFLKGASMPAPSQLGVRKVAHCLSCSAWSRNSRTVSLSSGRIYAYVNQLVMLIAPCTGHSVSAPCSN